jgi:DNA invertase Pin-like site-specific DNA recombinase
MIRAAVYARYSSDNQRPESITDQVASCRRLAAQREFNVLEEHVYSDEARSGAQWDRPGLERLKAAAHARQFEVVLVDDLSRLARDNYLMLTLMAELEFAGVRVVSVADGLDTQNAEATLGIQIRGIFNELALRDLKQKTLRGQRGQKERGYFCGEATFGYRSVPVGDTRVDKKGRPRPDGYRMEIDAREAAVVLQIFTMYVNGHGLPGICRKLNETKTPGRYRTSSGWSPSTVTRILGREKYIGKWTWNKTETRRDPRSGRKRHAAKATSEWITVEDEALRIVPQALWDSVQRLRAERHKTWPGAPGQRGFSKAQGTRQEHYPTHLFSGTLQCGVCGAGIGLVAGKKGGYYGCRMRQRHGCSNAVRVQRKLLERVVVAAVQETISTPHAVHAVLRKVEEEVRKQCGDGPEKLRLKEADLGAEERRLSNFVEFVAEGRGSLALAKAIQASETRVEELKVEIASMRAVHESVFRAPPIEWVEDRLRNLRGLLEDHATPSALALRKLLGEVKLEPQYPDIGRPYYVAHTRLGVLDLLDMGACGGPGGGGEAANSGSLVPILSDALGPVNGLGSSCDRSKPVSDPGTHALRWWRRRR